MTTLIKKILLWALLLTGTAALGGALLLRPSPYSGSFKKGVPDISRPDALIRSTSLAKLPPDLLRIPLARDVLTEDFVAYYEANENRMALSGTLRRIAYEHELDFPEKLLESVFDESAEVALWRDDAGRLQDFVVVLSRNTLARIIQTLLPAAVKATDMQLSSAGKLDGTDVDILALDYGTGRSLLLLSEGDRIVALSNPGMLLGEKNTAGNRPQAEKTVKVIKDLLKNNSAISPFARHFMLENPLAEQKHELIFASRVFAFNYEKFLPGLKALSLSFDNRGEWQNAALFDGAAWDAGDGMSLWAALPHGPGFCVALPVNWPLLNAALNELNSVQAPRVASEETAPEEKAADFSGPAAVCWYKDSRLYAPLFATRLSAGAGEKRIQDIFKLAARATKAGAGETSTDAMPDFALWQGRIASPYGWSDGSGGRSLTPALAIRGDRVFFSPNATLVKSALDVAAKRYPALADSLGGREEQAPLAFADPQAIAALLRDEIFASLPRREEALFRNAAEAYLVPRLDALARYPAQRIEVAQAVRKAGTAWYPLIWKPAR